jgi:hypothetical protein
VCCGAARYASWSQTDGPSLSGVRVLQLQPGERGTVRIGLPAASAAVLRPKARFAGDLPSPLSPLRGALVRAAAHPKHALSLTRWLVSCTTGYSTCTPASSSDGTRTAASSLLAYTRLCAAQLLLASMISDFWLSSGLLSTGGLGSAPHSVPGGPPAADQHTPVERIHQPPGLLHHVRCARCANATSPQFGGSRDSSFLAVVCGQTPYSGPARGTHAQGVPGGGRHTEATTRHQPPRTL